MISFLQCIIFERICYSEWPLSHFVKPKRPPGNCYVRSFITDKTALKGLEIWDLLLAKDQIQNMYFLILSNLKGS